MEVISQLTEFVLSCIVCVCLCLLNQYNINSAMQKLCPVAKIEIDETRRERRCPVCTVLPEAVRLKVGVDL